MHDKPESATLRKARWRLKNPGKGKEYRQKNPARAKQQATHKNRYTERKSWVASIKAKPCMDCGGTFPSCCMDFDHRPGTVKVAGVGQMMWEHIEKVKAEIEKCDLVCANCHRIRTHLTR
jgi:hypothetical protein